MNLQTQIEELKAAIPGLSPRDQSFASDLVTYFGKKGYLTPKQEPWVAKLIGMTEKQRDLFEVNVGGDYKGLMSLFKLAKESLKYPKIVVGSGENTFVLALAGAKSKHPGTVTVVSEGSYHDRVYYGRLAEDGTWMPSRSAILVQADLEGLLVELSIDPAAVAEKHGKLTGKCCFCNSKLTDKRSTAAGFGETCARHYGLHDKWKNSVCLFEKAA